MKVNKLINSVWLFCAILTISSVASAHVNVYPKETTTGAYEKYTVRVPVEKDVNTTKVRIEFPAGVKVSTVQPVVGWDYAFEKDTEGRNKAITWTATQGGIKAHEFTEFAFVGANPKELGSGSLTWKAYQTYADGEVVEWTGEKDSKTPASVTTLKEGAAGDEHGHQATSSEPESQSNNNILPLILSGLALLISLFSLVRKKA